jgi:hypothetical protein
LLEIFKRRIIYRCCCIFWTLMQMISFIRQPARS